MKIIYYEKVRIYPNKHQEELFFKYFDINRGLYNNIIYKQKLALRAWALPFKTGIFDENIEFPEFNLEVKKLTEKRKSNKRLISTPREMQDMTIKRAFNAINNREKGQKLRFKNENNFKTFTLCHADRAVKFSSNGNKVKFSNDVGWIKIRKGREIPKNFTTMGLHCKNDKWYLIFNCQRDIIELPKTKNKIGIDLGITNIIADSNGVLIKNPRYVEKTQAKLIKLQQEFAESGYQNNKLKKQIAKLYEKRTNQLKDFQHKLANKIIKNNDFIVVENLNLKQMKEGKIKNYRKGLHNSNISQLIRYIFEKAESATRNIVKINPAYTSQNCSSCGYRDFRNRQGEAFRCIKCDFVDHADINAACNILTKGLEETLKNLVPVAETGSLENNLIDKDSLQMTVERI